MARGYTGRTMAIRKTTGKRKSQKRAAPAINGMPPWEFWEGLMELGRRIPPEEWAKVPSDAASRLDEYLEGMILPDE
jgi:hypothetical protein